SVVAEEDGAAVREGTFPPDPEVWIQDLDHVDVVEVVFELADRPAPWRFVRGVDQDVPLTGGAHQGAALRGRILAGIGCRILWRGPGPFFATRACLSCPGRVCTGWRRYMDRPMLEGVGFGFVNHCLSDPDSSDDRSAPRGYSLFGREGHRNPPFGRTDHGALREG